MTKPHIKVIQRNGVDVFVTSSMEAKFTAIEKLAFKRPQWDCTVDYGDNHPVWQGINNPLKKVKPRRRFRDGEEIFRFNLLPALGIGSKKWEVMQEAVIKWGRQPNEWEDKIMSGDVITCSEGRQWVAK